MTGWSGLAGVVVVAAMLAGCGGGGTAAGGGNKAGVATGRVTKSDGKPIDVAGALVEVDVSGVGQKSGENITYEVKPDADGNYEVKLADGRYQASARVTVPFEGKEFMFDLKETGPKGFREDQDSANGPVFNFEWRLSGVRDGGSEDVKNWAMWYGGAVDVKFARVDDAEAAKGNYPAKGTKFTFTLKPTGKLADGSEGKELTFERSYDDVLMMLDNEALVDVPLGEYVMTGKEAGGKELEFAVSTEPGKYSGSAEIKFEPRGIEKNPMGQMFLFRRK